MYLFRYIETSGYQIMVLSIVRTTKVEHIRVPRLFIPTLGEDNLYRINTTCRRIIWAELFIRVFKEFVSIDFTRNINSFNGFLSVIE